MARMTKRSDGRYQLKVTTPNGPKVVYGKTQADAKRKADEMRRSGPAGALCESKWTVFGHMIKSQMLSGPESRLIPGLIGSGGRI